jgi:NTE family protein
MTKKKLAFVLGGGGARGALQVGAARALLEAGIKPDLLVGTSIGAVNATYMALNGFSHQTLDDLEKVWLDTIESNLLPPNYLWLSVRAVFGQPDANTAQRIRVFFTEHGLGTGACFGDIQGVELFLVAADLNSGLPVVYGNDPSQSVLEGVLASTALPPWIYPIESDGKLLADGGFASNLPIEPAMMCGATRIIALDLFDPAAVDFEPGRKPFLSKVLSSTVKRQSMLEIALAQARGVDLSVIPLAGDHEIKLWDFSKTMELIKSGYEFTRGILEDWRQKE